MCCPKQDDDDRVAVARICHLLASRDGVRIGEGITLVHQRYGHEMAHRIRARFRTLQPDDIGDIWNDTLFALARLALVGRFKKEGSLHGLICQITRRRAIDFLRRQGVRSQCQESLEETTHEERLFWIDEDISLDELLETIREAIRTLSGRQRGVLEAFANSGFNRKDDDFVVEASKLAREPLTRTQVCEALSKGLEKVAEYLRRRGY